MGNHHSLWENSLFLWSFSVAMLVYQRVYQIIPPCLLVNCFSYIPLHPMRSPSMVAGKFIPMVMKVRWKPHLFPILDDHQCLFCMVLGNLSQITNLKVWQYVDSSPNPSRHSRLRSKWGRNIIYPDGWTMLTLDDHQSPFYIIKPWLNHA